MVGELLDRHIPSTTRRVDGAEGLMYVREDRGELEREGSGETGAKLGASGEQGRQETTSSSGPGVSRDGTGGVEAAEDSCRDWVSESNEKCDDGQMGIRGDYVKSQG